MTISTYLTNIFKRIGSDLKALANRITSLEKHLGYLTIHVSTVRSDPDSDGIYRRITYKRRDGTIYKVSQLEHDPLIEVVGGIYNKLVVSIYNKEGTEIILSASYQLKYDANGVLVSETLL
jgi:hypothetical protein